MNRRAELITANYRERLRALRAGIATRLETAYADVDEADIRATFGTFVPVAARTIAAGQARAQTLTRAYIRGVAGFDPAPVPSLAGTSKAGSMTDGLTGILPLVLGAIADGTAPADALLAGGGYVDRLADAELTRVVDAEIDGQAKTGRLAGWEGTTYGATDDCVQNEGFHTFDEDMVRHPHCQCDRAVVAA